MRLSDIFKLVSQRIRIKAKLEQAVEANTVTNFGQAYSLILTEAKKDTQLPPFDVSKIANKAGITEFQSP